MKIYRTLIYFIAIAVLASCSGVSPEQKSIDDIAALEAQLYSDSSYVIDQNLALQTIQAYVDFAVAYPENPVSAEYYFKAGEISMSMNLSSQAIMYLNNVETKYPEYEKAPYSIFLQAFIYETQLTNFEKAKEYYSKFVEAYPDHEFADDAKISIENMGIPLDKLIEKFEAEADTIPNSDSVS